MQAPPPPPGRALASASRGAAHLLSAQSPTGDPQGSPNTSVPRASRHAQWPDNPTAPPSINAFSPPPSRYPAVSAFTTDSLPRPQALSPQPPYPVTAACLAPSADGSTTIQVFIAGPHPRCIAPPHATKQPVCAAAHHLQAPRLGFEQRARVQSTDSGRRAAADRVAAARRPRQGH
jgi:hypothetical protein